MEIKWENFIESTPEILKGSSLLLKFIESIKKFANNEST
jgi:hypothetical protein